MDAKDTYRRLCKQRTDIPLFLQPWWLDATDMAWDVILYQEKGQIRGIYVYSYCKKWGKTIITQPTLTQYSGPYLLDQASLSQIEQYSLQNKAYNYFIDQLEQRGYSFLEQNFHHSQTNHQPFYWQGFRQTTRYSYLLENIADMDAIWNGMSHRKRQKNISKTQGKFCLIDDMSYAEFYRFYRSTLQEKGKEIFYDAPTFAKLHNAAKSRQQGQILALYDEQNDLHVALWVVWDRQTAYNMIIAINPRYKSSGATSLIIWEALQFLQDKTQHYDFEGSMIQGVALKDQSFGAKQVAYHTIQKSHSKLYSLWRRLKGSNW